MLRVASTTAAVLAIATAVGIVDAVTYTGSQALVGLSLDNPTFTSTADAVITISRCHVTGLIAVQDSSRARVTVVDSFIDSFYTWSLTSGNATIRNTVVAGTLRVGSMATNSHLVVDNVTMNYAHSGLSTGFNVASVIGGGVFITNSRFTYIKNGFSTSVFFNVGSCNGMVLSIVNTAVNLTTVGVTTGTATAFATAALTSSTLNMTDVSILFSTGQSVERVALDVQSTMATSTELLHNVSTTGMIRHRYMLQSNVSARRLAVDGAPYIVCRDSAGTAVNITSSRFSFAPVDTTGSAPVAVTGNVGTMSFAMDDTVIDANCSGSFSGTNPPCTGVAWPGNQLDRMPLISLTNNVITVAGPKASAAVYFPRVTSSGRLVVAFNQLTVSSTSTPATGLYAEELNLDDSYVIDNVIDVSSDGNTATAMRVNGDMDGDYHLIANNTMSVTGTNMAYGVTLSGALSHVNNTLVFDGGSITVVSISLASYGIYRGSDINQGDISIRNVMINVSALQADAYGVHWRSSTSSTFELNRNEIAVSGPIASTRHVSLPGTWPSALVHILDNNFTSAAAAVEAPSIASSIGSAVTRCNIKEGNPIAGSALLPGATSLTDIPCGANVCIVTVDCNAERVDSVSYVNGTGCVCQCAPHLGGSERASAVSRPLQCIGMPELPAKNAQPVTTTTLAPATTTAAPTTISPTNATTAAANTTVVPETTETTGPTPVTPTGVPPTDQISTSTVTTPMTTTTTTPVNTTAAATLGPGTPTTPGAVAVANGTEPAVTAVPKAVSQATQGGAIVAGGGVAASSGSPAWAGHASRNALLASLGVCPQPLDGDDPLELMLNPTTLALGTGATRQYQGALAANCAIVFGIPLLQLCVATIARCVAPAADDASDDDRFERSFTGRVLWAKLPRANYVWFLLLVHPITQAGLILTGRSPDRPDLYLAGAAAFVVMAGISVFVAVQITGERLKAVFVPRRWTCGDDADTLKQVVGPVGFDRAAWEEATRNPPSNIFTRLFTPVGDWYSVDPGSRHATVHHGMFKPLYGPFRRHGRLFVLGEIVVALIFGIAGAMVPVDQAGCITQMAMLFSSMCLYMLFGLVARPFAEPIDNIILALLSLLETADCFCLLLVVTNPEETWAVDGSSWCAWLATWVTFLALAKDCALAIGRNILKARERASHAEATAKLRPSDGDDEEPVFSPNPIVSTAPFGLSEEPGVDPELLQAAEAEICESATADNAGAWLFDDTVEYLRFVGPELALCQPILWDDDSGHYFHGAVSMWFDPFNEIWYSEPSVGGRTERSGSDATEAATIDKA